MGFSSTEELENAIATCKQLIKQTPEPSTRRKDLIQQLIQLRLKLHEIKVIQVKGITGEFMEFSSENF